MVRTTYLSPNYPGIPVTAVTRRPKNRRNRSEMSPTRACRPASGAGLLFETTWKISKRATPRLVPHRQLLGSICGLAVSRNYPRGRRCPLGPARSPVLRGLQRTGTSGAHGISRSCEVAPGGFAGALGNVWPPPLLIWRAPSFGTKFRRSTNFQGTHAASRCNHLGRRLDAGAYRHAP